jgi:hypothetical protein
MMSDQPDGFTGAIAPPADPRYPALVRGFNLRFVGAPQYVHVCGSAEQVVQAVQAGCGSRRAGEGTATRISSPATMAA